MRKLSNLFFLNLPSQCTLAFWRRFSFTHTHTLCKKTFSTFHISFSNLLRFDNSFLYPSFHGIYLHRIMSLSIVWTSKKSFRQVSKFLEVKENKFTIQSSWQPSTKSHEGRALEGTYSEGLTAGLYFLARHYSVAA